ncbi:MAG: hypothetical protein PHV82_05520, partial [Victivallaceae bacterium]|nr:hypothetical protein [Victivallaceae bacterium]
MKLFSFLSIVFFLSCISSAKTPVAVTEQEERAWIYYTLPQPHRIAIKRKLVISPDKISICLADDADAVSKNAAELLRDFFVRMTG